MEFRVDTTVPVQFESIETMDDARFSKVKIWVCSVGKNLNRSEFSKKVIEDAIPSISNIPILGFIEVDNYNEADFKGHEQRIVIEKDGVSMVYVGRAYGVIGENNNAQFEFKKVDGEDVEFLTVEGILWNKFKESVEIFDRDGEKGHSMELEPASVEGTFSKDGIFTFSKFRFEGACILGDSVKGGIQGSVIEKFSHYTIQDEFKEMITEFNTYYSQFDKSDNTLKQNKQKNVLPEIEGGNKMDEKLELLTKFSQISDEDLKELKENLDTYSLEDLETKLTQMSETPESKVATKPTTEFALTASQLNQEIRNALSKERYMTEWEYEARSYWYIDHDESRVYCEDAQDNYRVVGINYTMNGDFVVLDGSTKKPVKFVPVDMDEGAEMNFSVVSEERSQFDIEQVKLDTEKEVTDKFQIVKTDLDAKTVELETLKTENESLVEFKLNVEKTEQVTQVESLFSKFEDLSEDDVKDLREKCKDMSMGILELNLYALRGRKQEDVKKLKESKESKGKNLVFNLTDTTNKQSDNKPLWAEIVDQYSN